jgi:hypothetical protein
MRNQRRGENPQRLLGNGLCNGPCPKRFFTGRWCRRCLSFRPLPIGFGRGVGKMLQESKNESPL